MSGRPELPSSRNGWEPGIAPVEVVAIDTTDVRVVVGPIACFPSGVEFEVSATSDLAITIPTPAPRLIERPVHRLEVSVAVVSGKGPSGSSTETGEFGLLPTSGGGSDHREFVRHWLAPLPTHGTVRFTVTWHGSAEITGEAMIDAAVLADAAGKARRVPEQ